MNAERFQKLIEAVEQAPDERFDPRYWKSEDPTGGCGFAGCAVGWYVHFNPDCGLALLPLRGHGRMGFEAVCLHFDISMHAAGRLFSVCNYMGFEPSRADVLDRIRKFYTAVVEVKENRSVMYEELAS